MDGLEIEEKVSSSSQGLGLVYLRTVKKKNEGRMG